MSLLLFFVAACSGSSDGGGTGNGGNGGGAGGGGGGGAASVDGGGAGPTTSATLNGGIGKVCSAASDCASGLDCHSDTTDWIAHHECTTSCQSDDDCTGRFGSHTMCIGAHLCVSKCLDDKDCPTGTACSTNGWCEHNGPGSGVPKCTGTPTACALLSDSECTTAIGCHSAGSCTGVAESCYSQYDQYSCNDLSGCYWDSSSKYCSGSTSPCSANSTSGTCALSRGCSWSSSCGGEQLAKTCESQEPSLCKYAPGCTLVPQ